MRDYAKFIPSFWIGETGKRLRSMGRDYQVIGAYLFTCPNSHMLGLYYLPIQTIAHELGYFEAPSKPLRRGVDPLQEAREALKRVCDTGFASYDLASEFVWVPEMARFQIGEALEAKDNRCKGIQKEYDALPSNPFLGAFFDRYAAPYHLTRRRDGRGPGQLLRSPLEAPSEPLRSQEQEQEQEQETPNTTVGLPKNADSVLEVFAHYRTYHKRAHPKPSSRSKEWRLIADRLAEGYSVVDLKLAIDGHHKSKHHLGHNDRNTKYLSLELCMRDSSKVQGFMELADPKLAAPPRPARSPSALPDEERVQSPDGLQRIREITGGLR